MSADLAAVQARVAQLQALVAPRRSGATATAPRAGASATGFDAALATALGGTAGADGALALTGAATPTTSGATGDAGARAVALARTFTGVPYRWGGTDPATGLDCSGLTQLVYRRLGVELPRVAADQARAGTAVASLAQARPGDLVFFGSPAHHVGIYVGDGKMIDAPRAGKTVGVHPLHGTPSAIRRVAPEVAVLPSGAATDPGLGTAGIGSAGIGSAGIGMVGNVANAGAGGLTGPYAALFVAAGRRHGVDPALLSAVAKAESAYNPNAVSHAGARGLMQLMPGTARSLGVNPLDPPQAVDGAARLLKQLLGRFDGRVDLALAGYNAGPGAVARYGGIPPYAETRTYVERVMRNWRALS